MTMTTPATNLPPTPSISQPPNMARLGTAQSSVAKKQTDQSNKATDSSNNLDSSSTTTTTIDEAKTPTRASFMASGQKPLPTEPFTSAVQQSPAPPKTTSSSDGDRPRQRDSSHHSKSSPTQRSVDDDMDMDDQSDGDEGEGVDRGDDNGASDDDSGNDDDSKSGKKKKSQRFYCTEYPPCNLSFTRSEHLARHIRKHTGERPFQCHCSRRFSRLDNLRQHAQTVHVNEDIPIDSLAATGSRFQRQIRTDRVRQAAGNRARASTGGSAGGPMRGHSKSLSTSSINSVSSVGSNYSIATDARRRPPPLVMAAGGMPQDPRGRTSLESYRSGGDSAYSSYRPPSPGDFTPTSATFSTGQSSPRWSGMASPASSHTRTQSMYTIGEGRVPSRRLSVPSGANPFQSPLAQRMTFPPGQGPTSNAEVFTFGDASPSASSSGWSRRESVSSAADEAWRRKTWHPDNRNYNSNTNQLNAAVSQPEAPNPPPPVVGPPHQQQPSSSLRLPGIESLINGPSTPPQRITSPMAVDSEPPPSVARRPLIDPQDDRRNNLNMYDANMQRRFDYRLNTPPRDSPTAWASEVHQSLQQATAEPYRSPPSVRFEEQPLPPQQYMVNGGAPGRSLHQQTMSAPSMATIREKRHGWYQGPAPARAPPSRGQPPAHVHQQPDQRAVRAEKMVHPNFNAFAGFPARQEGHGQGGQDGGQGPEAERRMGGLDALVAAATGEGSTAKAY